MQVVETFECLLEDRSDDRFVKAFWMRETHNVEHGAAAHESCSNVKFGALDPATSHSQDVGMLGKRHELGLSPQFFRVSAIGFKIDDLDRACSVERFEDALMDDRRSSESC